MIHSEEFDGMNSEEAKVAITEKVGGTMTNTYRLRDWSIGRQRYWGVPIPIVYDPEGMPHPIPKEHLPWHLPTDVDFTPLVNHRSQRVVSSKNVSLVFSERGGLLKLKPWIPSLIPRGTFCDTLIMPILTSFLRKKHSRTGCRWIRILVVPSIRPCMYSIHVFGKRPFLILG